MHTATHSAQRLHAEQQRIHDQALLVAASLRREAIDSFWRDAGAATAQLTGDATRAAERLARRLAQHGKQRSHAGA